MYREAIAELENAVNFSNRTDEVSMASLGKVLGDSGRKQEARKVLQELEERSKHRYMSPYLIALVQTGLGEKDQAIRVSGAGIHQPRSVDDVPQSGPADG
jgi:hypothetical protein